MSLKGKKNGYVCDTCGDRIVTIDADDGVTPFMTSCHATEGCKGSMRSYFYRIPQDEHATFEWYKPTAEATAKMPPHTRTHIEKGGLILRPLPLRQFVEKLKEACFPQKVATLEKLRSIAGSGKL